MGGFLGGVEGGISGLLQARRVGVIPQTTRRSNSLGRLALASDAMHPVLFDEVSA